MSDGSEGPGLFERVERHYFPERYGLHLFGDPWEQKGKMVRLHLDNPLSYSIVPLDCYCISGVNSQG